MSTRTDRAALTGYPVNLLVRDRRCVVVGAGRIAARKIEALLDAGAEVHVISPHLGDEVRAWRDAARVTVAERDFAPADLDGAWLATAATDDSGTNRAVFDAGEARHGRTQPRAGGVAQASPRRRARARVRDPARAALGSTGGDARRRPVE